MREVRVHQLTSIEIRLLRRYTVHSVQLAAASLVRFCVPENVFQAYIFDKGYSSLSAVGNADWFTISSFISLVRFADFFQRSVVREISMVI